MEKYHPQQQIQNQEQLVNQNYANNTVFMTLSTV
jgi:hypothetical protein